MPCYRKAPRLPLEPGHRAKARRADWRRLGAETRRGYFQGLGADNERVVVECWRACPGSGQQPGTPLELEMPLHRHQVHDGLSVSQPDGARSGRGQRLLLGRDHRRYPRRHSAAVLRGSPVSDRSQPGDCRGRDWRARHGNRRLLTGQPDTPAPATRDHDAIARPGQGPRPPGAPTPTSLSRPGQATPRALRASTSFVLALARCGR
jgi:hypothetical protein